MGALLVVASVALGQNYLCTEESRSLSDIPLLSVSPPTSLPPLYQSRPIITVLLRPVAVRLLSEQVVATHCLVQK